MARYVATTLINSPTPMWDSFEAVFFVLAGISVGIVFGVLFPSLWRTLRRYFRKKSRYEPRSSKWEGSLSLKLEILNDNLPDEQSTDNFDQKIYEAFSAARYFFHIGQTRKSVSLYVEILTHEKVSTQETNRALYELAQVYEQMGLHQRAYETVLELLNRKPSDVNVFKLLLTQCVLNFDIERLKEVLGIFKGHVDQNIRRLISHGICSLTLKRKSFDDLSLPIEEARLAVKWDRTSLRALELLWMFTSRQFWKRNENNPKMIWLSLATDLDAIVQINTVNKISCAIGSGYLAEVLEKLFFDDSLFFHFEAVKSEFFKAFSYAKINSVVQKKFFQCLLYSLVLVIYSFHQKIPSVEERTQKCSRLFFFFFFLKHEKIPPHIFQLSGDIKGLPCFVTGILAHHCTVCLTEHSSFQWNCVHCGATETHMPIHEMMNF